MRWKKQATKLKEEKKVGTKEITEPDSTRSSVQRQLKSNHVGKDPSRVWEAVVERQRSGDRDLEGHSHSCPYAHFNRTGGFSPLLIRRPSPRRADPPRER